MDNTIYTTASGVEAVPAPVPATAPLPVPAAAPAPGSAQTPRTIVTPSGFSFSPPAGLLDNWDFLETLSRMTKATSDLDAMAGYFDLANLLMGPDGLQRLKDHVRRVTGTDFPSFSAMRTELEEILSRLRDSDAGNGSSSPV